jgi:hypothetical protein
MSKLIPLVKSTQADRIVPIHPCWPLQAAYAKPRFWVFSLNMLDEFADILRTSCDDETEESHQFHMPFHFVPFFESISRRLDP